MFATIITGASGFIGSHVVREAARQGTDLTLMSHRRPLAPHGAAAARVVRADLTRPETLRGACEGMDVLLHCASQIGGSADANEAVNARGTAALVAEAQRAGVSRIVYLSTASVYGRGVFQGARPEQLTRRPGSPTSRTRAAAEDAVLAAGGIVLRPHLVYGEGDTWVVPGLVRLLRALQGGAEGWRSRMSAIAAPELAQLLLGVGFAPAGSLTASVYHAAHPRPVSAAMLLRAVAACAALPRAPGELTVAQARERLAGEGWARHGIDMLATDHWYDSAPLWADLKRVPGPAFEEDFPRMRGWYRELVQAA
ncbi:NAD-dependent epimerase/dehydratase family protein [Streptomyces sp. QHH-9511]|uniref:NAD-dependent epimerase/dehydratase family protein n=1 Tax=Streptomyces sp. QHH-9511 TaxID=2684468 RepID=UPI0013173F17|nr:NAD-dependent epimerase/dehydratase family protein [Streptomyces sp. QHH-9511]QGZ49433.1 NAD-dependent epimerase/dehydratase family protein [Streptomyces sp. QHH-9511]